MKFNINLISLIVLSIIEIFTSLKINSKNQIKSKGKNKVKGKVSINTMKNGPLSWDLLSQDDVLESLLKNEREENKRNNSANFAINPQNKINNRYPFTSIQDTNNLSFIQSKRENTSENDKSKTFRTVGPLDDTTINNNGVKYSKIFHNKSNRNLKPGFYGSSRLTRF